MLGSCGLWRGVGESLGRCCWTSVVQRVVNNGKGITPHDLAFGKWVKEMGFDNRPQQHRHAAMELAKLTPHTVCGVPLSITHPQKILAFLKDTATEHSDDASADPSRNGRGACPLFFRSSELFWIPCPLF